VNDRVAQPRVVAAFRLPYFEEPSPLTRQWRLCPAARLLSADATRVQEFRRESATARAGFLWFLSQKKINGQDSQIFRNGCWSFGNGC
jgi:hypothetical protein